MISSLTGRYHRNIDFTIVVVSIHVGKLSGQQVTVRCLQWSLFDAHGFGSFVNNNYNIVLSFTLNFDGIESTKLEEGTVKASHIAVHHKVGWRNGNNQRFSGS